MTANEEVQQSMQIMDCKNTSEKDLDQMEPNQQVDEQMSSMQGSPSVTWWK